MPSTAPGYPVFIPKNADTSSWPTQTEAAVRLGANERTIRRWIEAGRLKSALRPIRGRKPVVIIDPEDVERLRGELQPALMVTRESPPEPDFNGNGLVKIDPKSAAVIAALFDAVRASAPPTPLQLPAPKPWLTLAEAVEYSGLPASFLLSVARGGGDPDHRDRRFAINVGAGKREFWRFNREALGR